MSASGYRFDVDWHEIRETQADGVKELVPKHDDQTAEEAGVEDLQEKDMMGTEAEHITERHIDDIPGPVTRDFTREHMKAIAEHPSAKEVNHINMAQTEEVASVELEFDEYEGTSDVDVGAVEKEDVTGLVRTIDDLIQNLEKVEQVTAETNPDENVEFRRQGHTTGMMLRGSGTAFDWDKAEAGIYPTEEFISGAPRYFAFNDTFEGVMQVAGTGSIQTTMRPKIYEEHEGDPDAWIRDFSGGGDRIGMHALSPLIYGPFQCSPVISRVEMEDGFKQVIETLNGRDKAYGNGFQNVHDRKGLGKDEGEYVTENSKAAYSPELAEIQGMEDQVEFPATSEMTFSNEIEASKMKVVEEGTEYDRSEEYETLDEVSFVDSDESGFMRVGHEDWDVSDGVIETREFVEEERLEGTVYIVDEDGNRERKRVVVDYGDEESFPEMDREDFIEEAIGHYAADATAVWESWRMRPDKPAFEYRDMCNNPFTEASIATQAGAFRKWREIQDFAEDTLGLTEEDAQELRLGTNGHLADHENDPDYLDDVGLDYTINSEEDITLQDAWLMDDGLLDIISEGVDEMTTGEVYSAEAYRSEMQEILENGLTPGEMMAKEYGVEMDGDVLYSPEDVTLGSSGGAA